MLLYVAKHVLHVVVLGIVRVGVVIGATPVAVRSRWELHVHYWRVLVREVLRLLAVVLRRAVTCLV